MNKKLREIEVKISYVLWSLKRLNKIHIGEMCTLNGVLCQIIQGVGAPYYDLLIMSKENLDRPKREIYKHVHKKEFKLKRSIQSYILNFKQSYDFRISCWLSNDCYGKKLFDPISYLD